MPIKGVSEVRRITRGGHIRLGEMKETANGKQYPSKVDYFIADFDDPENARIFHELYGEKPKKIEIAFAYETIDENFPQWYKFYGKSAGLRCKGDGEKAIRVMENGEYGDVECPEPDYCNYCMMNGKPQCTRNASLQFFIKGIPGLCVYQINTTSFNSIVNINSNIDLLRNWRNGAPISGLWLELELAPQFAHAQGKKVTIYTLRLNIKNALHEILAQRQDWRPPASLPAPLDVYDPLLAMEPDPFVSTAPVDDEEYAEAAPVSPVHNDDAPDWADDEDIREHIEAIPAVKCAALLKSALKNGWTKLEFLEVLRKQGHISAPHQEQEEQEPPRRNAAPGTSARQTRPRAEAAQPPARQTAQQRTPAAAASAPAAKLGHKHPDDSF